MNLQFLILKIRVEAIENRRFHEEEKGKIDFQILL